MGEKFPEYVKPPPVPAVEVGPMTPDSFPGNQFSWSGGMAGQFPISKPMQGMSGFGQNKMPMQANPISNVKPVQGMSGFDQNKMPMRPNPVPETQIPRQQHISQQAPQGAPQQAPQSAAGQSYRAPAMDRRYQIMRKLANDRLLQSYVHTTEDETYSFGERYDSRKSNEKEKQKTTTEAPEATPKWHAILTSLNNAKSSTKTAAEILGNDTMKPRLRSRSMVEEDDKTRISAYPSFTKMLENEDVNNGNYPLADMPSAVGQLNLKSQPKQNEDSAFQIYSFYNNPHVANIPRKKEPANEVEFDKAFVANSFPTNSYIDGYNHPFAYKPPSFRGKSSESGRFSPNNKNIAEDEVKSIPVPVPVPVPVPSESREMLYEESPYNWRETYASVPNYSESELLEESRSVGAERTEPIIVINEEQESRLMNRLGQRSDRNTKNDKSLKKLKAVWDIIKNSGEEEYEVEDREKFISVRPESHFRLPKNVSVELKEIPLRSEVEQREADDDLRKAVISALKINSNDGGAKRMRYVDEPVVEERPLFFDVVPEEGKRRAYERESGRKFVEKRRPFERQSSRKYLGPPIDEYLSSYRTRSLGEEREKYPMYDYNEYSYAPEEDVQFKSYGKPYESYSHPLYESFNQPRHYYMVVEKLKDKSRS